MLNIQNRADLVLGAIKHFQSLSLGSDPIGGHIDFLLVGLMGHSRGGEVALLVPELLAMPSTGISGVKVRGVISVAPTDIGATGGKPTGFAFMTILPAADLDVVQNDGAKFYDQASADPSSASYTFTMPITTFSTRNGSRTIEEGGIRRPTP